MIYPRTPPYPKPPPPLPLQPPPRGRRLGVPSAAARGPRGAAARQRRWRCTRRRGRGPDAAAGGGNEGLVSLARAKRGMR